MGSFRFGVALGALLAPAAALAQEFHVGDHVTIGSTGDPGTVVAVGQRLGNGGVMLRIHLDRMAANPNISGTYDSAASHVTLSGSGPGPSGMAGTRRPSAAASGQGFQVGDHVTIGSTGDTGTVLEVGRPLPYGGFMVRIHLDRLAANPNISGWYDSTNSNVTVNGHGPGPAGAAAPRRSTASQSPPRPAQADPAIPNPPGNVASAAVCQQLIRANYPPTGADQTITVSFLSFQMGGQRPYEAVYANDRNGRGHTVSAAPIHARYTVLTHYENPRADDELRTYDAQFMCYRSAAGGGWVVEMVSRLPGGERAQYIHKL